MDTTVTVEAVTRDGSECADAIGRAFEWFAAVERQCSRFDPSSELRQLSLHCGEAIPVSPLLFEALTVALRVAQESMGAFDPTVGAQMEALGFDRNYRSGESHPSGLRSAPPDWRAVVLRRRNRTVTLRRPVLLDLGGVAKGLAIDLALMELRGLAGGAVDAGGDIAVFGINREGGAWKIGVQHPREEGALAACLEVAQGAVCTSGDYRRRARGQSHHVRPVSGEAVDTVASCTVYAPTAVVADALSTAATVMGPEAGIRWLGDQGAEGLIITPDLCRLTTEGWEGLQC